MSELENIFHHCALAAFVDALPLDEGHRERSRVLACRYYEEELCRKSR